MSLERTALQLKEKKARVAQNHNLVLIFFKLAFYFNQDVYILILLINIANKQTVSLRAI